MSFAKFARYRVACSLVCVVAAAVVETTDVHVRRAWELLVACAADGLTSA